MFDPGPVRLAKLASAGDTFALGGVGTHTRLHSVSVGVGAANASVGVYQNVASSATSRIASLDASAARYFDFKGGDCPDGLNIVLYVGNAFVTIAYS